MSDDPHAKDVPVTDRSASDAPAPVPDAPAPPPQTGTPPQQASTPPVPRPPAPVVDYAMPAQKSYVPSSALIKNLGCLIKMLFGLTVLLGMGYFALVALNPKARQWATQGAKDGSGGPTPFKVINQILAIPAQAMGKTDDVVKANNARVGQLDNLVAEEEAKAKTGRSASRPVIDPFASPAASTDKKGGARSSEAADASPQAVSAAAMLALAEKRAASGPAPDATPPTPSPRPPVAAPAAPDTPDEMKLPGGIIIAQASSAGSPRASAAFFFWIVKLNVSGITQGKPARALLNSRLTYEGDEVNRPLGIVFTQLDSTNKVLVFRDSTGATVTRGY